MIGAGLFRSFAPIWAALAAAAGSGLVGFVHSAAGAVARTVQAVLREQPLTPQTFGAVGDGVADDTAALTSFFAAASGRVCILPAGTYRATALLSVALSNCRFIGVPGQTTIVGNFGYAVLRLLDLSNVTFEGIEFKTEYASAVEDTGTSVVYSMQNLVRDVVFRRCGFTSPNANTNGLTIYARTGAADQSGTIDGLWIEDCSFHDVGRMGCTIMNRSTTADQFTAAQRVHFNRNHGKNLGMVGGPNGFLISFDGYGQHFTCNDNLIENALLCGIENTRWRNGEFKGNRFRDFSRAWSPMSFSGGSSQLVIAGNQTLEAASMRCTFADITDSRFHDNRFQATGDYALAFRNGSDCRFRDEKYISDGIYAALIGAAGAVTTDNTWEGCLFDNSASAGNNSCVRFDGGTTQRNRIRNAVILKGAGGYIADQVNAAIGNFVDGYRTHADLPAFNYYVVNLPDADYTLTGAEAVIRYATYRFNGALTADRTITFPDNVENFHVSNTTSFNLTIKTVSGAGVVIPPKSRSFVTADQANGLLALDKYDNNWNLNYLTLGTYSLWVDVNGKLRIKAGAPTADGDGTVVGSQA